MVRSVCAVMDVCGFAGRRECGAHDDGRRDDAVQRHRGLHRHLLHCHAHAGRQHAQLPLHPLRQLLRHARRLQGGHASSALTMVWVFKCLGAGRGEEGGGGGGGGGGGVGESRRKSD